MPAPDSDGADTGSRHRKPNPVYTTTVAATVARRLDPLSSATIPARLRSARPRRSAPVMFSPPKTISGVVVTQIYYGPPPGYEPVWSDGRLNPNRGLPEIQAQVPVAANPPAGNLAPARNGFRP